MFFKSFPQQKPFFLLFPVWVPQNYHVSETLYSHLHGEELTASRSLEHKTLFTQTR